MQVIMLKWSRLRTPQSREMSRILHLHLDYMFTMESRLCNIPASTSIIVLIDILVYTPAFIKTLFKRMRSLVTFLCENPEIFI